MNDLGMTLAWLAVRATLVLAPTLVIHALAGRRGPAARAWVSSLGLGLVLVLSVATLPIGIAEGTSSSRAEGASRPRGASWAAATSAAAGRDVPRREAAAGRVLGTVRIAWDRLGREAAGSVARFRAWGSLLAAFTLAGSAVGGVRLVLGLGAVAICRRRGRVVDDPELRSLVDGLAGAIGCRGAIEVRELAGLAGPATAGWWRPLVLLPEDWRSWEEAECRAVLAHELAHVARGDYATGLLARWALVVHPFHPLVHWLAGRLRLEQELAADAIGARHAGGAGSYLAALSRMALRQDEVSSSWPARAFLPGRGTLIRRIAMLRHETQMGLSERPWSWAQRLGPAGLLLALTAAAAMLRGPAVGAEAPATTAEAADPRPPSPPGSGIADMPGVIEVRPAALARREGMGRLKPLRGLLDLGFDVSKLSADLKVDPSRPGFLKLGVEDLDWVCCRIRFGSVGRDRGDRIHTLQVGRPVFRTAAPFDWLAYLRQWRFAFTEVREGARSYYKIADPWAAIIGPDPCVALPDDRTIMLDDERAMRRWARGEAPAPRPRLLEPRPGQGPRGVIAMAIDNHDGSFVKDYDLGRPDDAEVLSLFRGVDRWLVTVDDADPLVLRAAADCRAGEAVAKAIDGLLKTGIRELRRIPLATVPAGVPDRAYRMSLALLTGLRIERTEAGVELLARDIGTFADIAAILEAEAEWETPSKRDDGARRTNAKP